MPHSVQYVYVNTVYMHVPNVCSMHSCCYVWLRLLLWHESSPNHSAGHPFGSLEASQKTCWKWWLKKSLLDIIRRRCFWQFHGTLALRTTLPGQTTGPVGILRSSDMEGHGPGSCSAPCVAHALSHWWFGMKSIIVTLVMTKHPIGSHTHNPYGHLAESHL